MLRKPKSIQNVYLLLILGNTLATSFIWGINTIFLLDAGLSNFQAFLANAFFTLGQVIFEVPTGIIADTFGRRASYLLGSLTLAVSTFFIFIYVADSRSILGLGSFFNSSRTWLHFFFRRY